MTTKYSANLVMSFGLVFALYFYTGIAAANPAPHSLSLSEAIEKAKEQNPDRTTISAQREAILSKKRRALAPSSPTFGFGVGDLASQPGPENSNLRTYQLSQSFGFPGKASSEARSLELEAESVGFDLESKDQEIARLVRVAFAQLILTKKRLELVDLKHSSFEKILKIAKRRFVKDTTTEVEFLTAQGALQSIDNERSDFSAAERAVRSKLNILIGEQPEHPLEIQSPPLPELPFKPDRSSLRNALLEKNFQLKTSERKAQAFESRVTQAKRNLLPDFKLTAGTNNYGAYAGVVELSVPMWFLWNENESIHGANQEYIAQEAQVESEKRRLTQSLEEQISLLEALSEKLGKYKTGLIPNSERAFKVALANYGYGKIDFPTLTGSVNAFVNSQMEYESLLTDFLVGQAELEEALGGAVP